MTCKECQELILSDYLDGELESKQERALEAHISECDACRALAGKAKAQLVAPFEDKGRIQPPEAVWQNIKAGLEVHEQQAFKPQRPGLPDWLTGLRFPSFALGTAVVVLVAVAVFRQPVAPQSAAIEELEEEVSYLAFMMGPESPDEETDGYGTAIEEYFL